VHVPIDLRVLGFAIGVSVLTAVLFGLSPALRCARADVTSALRGARTTTRRLVTGDLMVVAQVGICTLLLLSAALMIATLQRMRSMNPGFDADHIVTFTIDPSMRGYSPHQSRTLSTALLNQARVLPGVTSASIASRGLMRGTGIKATFGTAGLRISSTDFLNSSLNSVTPGYFKTMGIHLLAGRVFDWFDRNQETPHKVVVNQTFAQHFFPGKNPIGERFGSPEPGGVASADAEIIGVVSDAKYRSLREPIPPTVYNPVVDGFDSDFILHVRTRANPDTVIAPVRRLLHTLDPELPLIEVHTLREEVEASIWQERLLAVLSTIFGAIAALLAGIGLYGALDYAVKSRTQEIGVRAALGAQPTRIVALFSRQAGLLTAGGVVFGLCAHAAVAAWLQRMLYGLRVWEPGCVLIVLLLVGLTAALAVTPAICGAVRIDPASALRGE
jgi:predicted permease